MTIKETKILRNMVLIGGTMTTGSFFFGMAKFSSSYNPKINYEKKKFTGEIKTISNLEDFERSNNCNFLFYDSTTAKSANAKGARDYSNGDKGKESKVITKAQAQRQDCTENRFVYINLQ